MVRLFIQQISKNCLVGMNAVVMNDTKWNEYIIGALSFGLRLVLFRKIEIISW